MDRRAFLKRTAAVAGAGVASPALSAGAADAGPPGGLLPAGPTNAAAHRPQPLLLPAAPLIAAGDEALHRRRLENIALCQREIQQSLRTHLVTDYLPGQCVYNLGEYPSQTRWEPSDEDERELDRLRDHGIRLLQVHEEWNDSQRLFGSHKLDAVNPAGFRRFVEMVHRRGMRIIVYISSGYFQRSDPDFQPSWAGPHDLREIYFRYAGCSPANPGWRAYLLPRIARILDEYGVDGLYNDLGYRQPGSKSAAPDEVLAFPEDAEHDGALADLLALIYSEVKRRGGVVKVHRGGIRRPNTELKVYDYLWVGEGARDGDRMRQFTKDFPPYVVPCLDMSRARLDHEDDLYLQSLPYLQFPLLLAGRPVTGQRALVPGIEYPPEEKCFWTRHMRAIWKYRQEHPEGPPSYGWWDSVPGRPEARPTHHRWLKIYRPLVEEGTWAWLEITRSTLFRQPLPAEVVASAFANRDLHLVLANYGREPLTVTTTARYTDLAADDAPGAGRDQWTLPARSLRLLRRTSN